MLREHSDEFLRGFFKDAFECEFDPIVLPENERSYYVALVNGCAEAPFGIRENRCQLQVRNISSFARIIDKEKTDGWQYLKAILDLAIEKGVKVINATVNDAGEKTFKELESNGGLPKNCRIEWSPRGYLKGVLLLIEYKEGDAMQGEG